MARCIDLNHCKCGDACRARYDEIDRLRGVVRELEAFIEARDEFD